MRSVERFLAAGNKIKGPRVLVADIETFPITAYVWGMFKQNIGLEQIAEDWALMSFAAKWLGRPEVYYSDNRRMENPREDAILVSELHDILSAADMVIAHNGQKFDLPKIRARMAIRGYSPLPPIKVIDTLLLNRKAFGFTSHRLAYVSEQFANEAKDEHNAFPGFKLWRECLAGNLAAWRECEKYNIRDVTSLEETYLALRGWYEGAPNFGPYIEPTKGGELVCPNCGGTHVIHRGTRKTQVGIYARYRCQDCGSWSRGRLMTATRAQRAHILTN